MKNRAGNRHSAHRIVELRSALTHMFPPPHTMENRAGNRYSAHRIVEPRSALAHAARMSDSLCCYWWRCFHYRYVCHMRRRIHVYICYQWRCFQYRCSVTHARMHTSMRARTHTHTGVHPQANAHRCMIAGTHTHRHTHRHTHAHTHAAHTHTHMLGSHCWPCCHIGHAPLFARWLRPTVPLQLSKPNLTQTKADSLWGDT